MAVDILANKGIALFSTLQFRKTHSKTCTIHTDVFSFENGFFMRFWPTVHIKTIENAYNHFKPLSRAPMDQPKMLKSFINCVTCMCIHEGCGQVFL